MTCYYISEVPFLVLTGTADKSTLEVVIKDLQLRSPVFIFVGPERKNLRFSINKVRQDEMFKRLSWLIELIRNEGIGCPKTLIFCNTLNANCQTTANNCHKIFTINDIVSQFATFSITHACKILEIFNDIFMDIPESEFEQTPERLQVELSCNVIPFEQTLSSYFASLDVSGNDPDEMF